MSPDQKAQAKLYPTLKPSQKVSKRPPINSEINEFLPQNRNKI